MSTRLDPDSASAATQRAGDTLVGRRVHKYQIVRVIGRGGMGTVYEAINTDIGKRVAMKFVDRDTSEGADAVARFQREAQAASAVESAHIVEIFDSGTTEDGIPFIVMELLRGEDLGHQIKRCGRLDLGLALRAAAQILRGLDRAHKAGIVHRDLKPDNIFLVDRDDDPSFAKILDFGVSKVRKAGNTTLNTLTRKGTVVGTPYYMSPEQAQAQPDIDGRTDLWSVGAILFECLTGRPPHTGASYEQVIVNICMHDADDVRLHNPAVPEPVAAVIAKALTRDRNLRFQDARSFLETLRAAAGGLISSRTGTISSDDIPGYGSDSGSPPAADINGATTTPRTLASKGSEIQLGSSSGALDPTVEFPSKPVGGVGGLNSGTARRRAIARRRRRMFLLVAATGLVAGGISAFIVARAVVRRADAGAMRAVEAVRATTSAAPVVPSAQPGAAASDLPEARVPTETPKPTEAPSAAASATTVGKKPPKTVPSVPQAPGSAKAAASAAPSTAPTPSATSHGVAEGLKLRPY